VFAPFAFGYFLSYLYRVVNAVIAPDLVTELSLSAAQLGYLSSVYFLAFAAFQLPLGLLLDRYGPRRTESVLLLFAVAGALVFAVSESAAGLTSGRAMIGLGVSACLMAAFKAFSQWFPRERLPLLNGLQMAAGGAGALTATAPVEAALGLIGWRGVFVTLAVLTFISAAAIWLLSPERRSVQQPESFANQLRGLRHIFTSPLFWRVAPWCVAAQAAQLSIVSLWSGPWLRDVAGLDRTTVAIDLAWIAAAMIAGFASIGAVAERLGRRGITPIRVASVGMFGFMIAQAMLLAPPLQFALPLWMAFAFLGTSGIVPYAGLSQQFALHLTGRVNTSLNVLAFSASFVSQWGIGLIIGRWPTQEGHFAAAGYRAAFAAVLAVQCAAALWYFVAPRLLRRDAVRGG
jgi:predicted MFS family arabinose efflux permease